MKGLVLKKINSIFFIMKNKKKKMKTKVEDESHLNENILVAYFYLSDYKPREFFAKNKNFHIFNIYPYNSKDRKTYLQLKKEGLKLKDYRIIFIDGGNSFDENIGEGKELGDDFAKYIEKGGNFCTLGYTNVANCGYSVRGRYHEERLQVVQGNQLFPQNRRINLISIQQKNKREPLC